MKYVNIFNKIAILRTRYGGVNKINKIHYKIFTKNYDQIL